MCYECIDILDLYNSKMILNEYDDIAISTWSDCFLCDSMNKVTTGDVPFILPRNSKKNIFEVDNISCEGQMINLENKENRRYKVIYFVGFCEWGDMRGGIELSLEDGKKVNRELFFYDWYRTSQDFFLYDVKDSNCVLLKVVNTFYGKKSLYLYKVDTEAYSSNVTQIKLPFIPNMHIFAVTLGY